MDAFNLKPVQLSETVYSETISDMRQARKSKDERWLAELYVDAFILLEDAGLVNRNKTPNSERYEELLWHAHLDAQIPIPAEEKHL